MALGNFAIPAGEHIDFTFGTRGLSASRLSGLRPTHSTSQHRRCHIVGGHGDPLQAPEIPVATRVGFTAPQAERAPP